MKALACDFDGTFYFMGEKEPVKQCDIDAVKEFQSQGHLFGFCTGRPLYGLTDYLNDQVKADFYILNSGATIFDKDQNIIFEKTIPKEITDTLISYGVEHNYSVDFHMDGKFFAFGKSITFITDEIYTLEEVCGKVHNITYDAKTPENADELAKHVNSLFEGQVCAFCNTKYVDIVPAGCSKGFGIDFVRNYLNIDLFASIGDSMNDYPMFEKTEPCFTFSYAPEVLQKKATHLVKSVAEAIQIML